MLFAMKNGPPTFKRNAVIMQEDLLQNHTKSNFHDIIGKAAKLNYYSLRSVSVTLLQRMRKHGWKLKLRKWEWEFEVIESVGFVWSENRIGMNRNCVESMKILTLPQNLTQLQAFLGLANQFHNRVPGYALMVSHLTALTRWKTNKVLLTPEAIIEFEDIKAILISPMVLQQFNYTRKTFVYTNSSGGT